MPMCIFESYNEMLEKAEAEYICVQKQCHNVKYKKKMERVRRK